MKGLFQKHTIINNETGEPVSGFAFVLRPETDLHARAALQTYIASVHEDNPHLAADLAYELQRICPLTAPVELNPNQKHALEKLRGGGSWELRNLGGASFSEMMALCRLKLVEYKGYKGFNGVCEYFALATQHKMSGGNE